MERPSEADTKVSKKRSLRSRDSVLGRATGYGLNDRGVGVRAPVGSRIFFLLHAVQIGSGVHPTSYAMVTGGKAAGA
jgi:hypothetical protein